MHGVIVVGAGVAGLAAAYHLTQAGRRVTLLEARPHLGGRIHTVLDPVFRHPVELGAEFVQGEPPEFLRTIEALGLELHEVFHWRQRARQGAERPLPEVDAVVDRLLALRASDLEDVPVSQLIQRARAHFTSDELESVTAYLESFHGADLDRFGSAALAENQGTQSKDGDRVFRMAGGYGQLVSRMIALMDSKHLQVRTETTVTRLRWRPGQVEVEARSREGKVVELTGAQAILTQPLGTLKAGRGAEAAVHIDPEPAGWQQALACLEMGLAQRIDLQFETAWWMQGDRSPPTFVRGSDEPFRVWWTTTPPELPFLTGWTGGPRARGLAGRSHDELVKLALQSASSIFGYSVQDLERRLRAAYSHDWLSDAFSRGAYSYGGVGAIAAREVLRTPVAATLFLSGEALDTQGRNATVPGALASGLRTAAIVLEGADSHGFSITATP